MAVSKETKLAIKAKLRLGRTTPKEIAAEMGVKLPTVYAMKREVEREAEDAMIDDLHKIPQEIVHTVVEEAKKTATPTMAKEFEAVEAGADGLKKLDMKFQETVTIALERFDAFLRDESTPLKDVKTIVDTTANAYEKVFNSGTNIHIGDNNNNSTQQLTVFKNKMGV
jgi:hypothetical protein